MYAHTHTYSVVLLYCIFYINIKNCFLNHHMNIKYTWHLYFIFYCVVPPWVSPRSHITEWTGLKCLLTGKNILFFTHYIGLQCLFLVFASGPGSSETSLRGIGKPPSLCKAKRLDNERLYYILSSTASCSNRVKICSQRSYCFTNQNICKSTLKSNGKRGKDHLKVFLIHSQVYN